MLTLGRYKGQGLYIDLDIYVKVVDIVQQSNGEVLVRLAIDVPPDVAVTRSELGILAHEHAQKVRDAGGVPRKEDIDGLVQRERRRER
jgi:sRNA-binding carbon storage regulator CsrA